MRIAVIDYGMGNLRSVSKALERVAPGAQVLLTAEPEAILSAERLVVPGQGALPDCMRQLAASGARGALIGTALHTGAITQKEIAALLRERRP